MSESSRLARTRHTFGVLRDNEADWVFGRTLQYMSVGAAQSGECLDAARRINEKDPDSWVVEWSRVGEKVERHGRESASIGCNTSAKYSYLRASNYYRTAEYGCRPASPSFHVLWEKSVVCFREAVKYFKHPVMAVEVPVEGYMLPGYYWRACGDDVRPTIVLVGGNDVQ